MEETTTEKSQTITDTFCIGCERKCHQDKECFMNQEQFDKSDG